jgi:pilus assembly protein Flp/PilA
MKSLKQWAVEFLKADDGPTAVEYAFMLALIIAVCFTAITTLGGKTNQAFGSAANGLSTTSS